GAAAVQPAALRLRVHLCRANRAHVHLEDLLNRLRDLQLVRTVVDPERVLALGHQGIALLGDDRLDDHLARVHHLPPCFSLASPGLARDEPLDGRSLARLVSSFIASSDTTSDPAPMTSATPAAFAWATATPSMFRKLFAAASSSEPITTR